ncbi:hypothetical protein, conserved [Trypanosoma brucei brucei TREU927]|uniref:VHS domain-containing protein n=1 Tax=Trypanosoma brucei brucei (strain 927/4 GUTat10.1) TaxID=185431 RepID=Q38BV8_TRYB2|nr:hypothetical protein, conserved [Trypanosoma brucei brucei TREU927]EAN77712.1 hypothetical protein, conserved [Trypanosoma brucei brucei TREU927]
MDWALFSRAVEDSDEPTPAYIYREVARWTMHDLRLQRKLIDALFTELNTTSSPRVMCKVLRIIKAVCEMGHDGFQQEVQKGSRVAVVKRFVSHGAVPGNAQHSQLCEKVRQTAREAMEAIFGDHQEIRKAAMTSYGSGSSVDVKHCRSGIASAGGGVKQPTESTTGTTGVLISTVAEKVVSSLGILTKREEVLRRAHAKEQLYSDIIRATSSNSGEGLLSEADMRVLHCHDSGVAFEPPPSSNCESNHSTDSAWGFISGNQKVGDGSVACVKGAGVSGHSPQPPNPFQICVQRLCQVKNTPQRVELYGFVTQCLEIGEKMMQQQGNFVGGVSEKGTEVSCWSLLAEAVDEQMTPVRPWQRRLNALTALEALLLARGDDPMTSPMRRDVADYFCKNPQGVERNVSVVQATLREQARRLVELLCLPAVISNSSVTGDLVTISTAGIPVVPKEGQLVKGVFDNFKGSSSPESLVGGMEHVVSTENVTTSRGLDVTGMTLRGARHRSSNRTTLRRRAPVLEARRGDIDGKGVFSGDRGPSEISRSAGCGGASTDAFPAGTDADLCPFHYVDEKLRDGGATRDKFFTEQGASPPIGNSVLDELFGGTTMCSTVCQAPSGCALPAGGTSLWGGGTEINGFDPFSETSGTSGDRTTLPTATSQQQLRSSQSWACFEPAKQTIDSDGDGRTPKTASFVSPEVFTGTIAHAVATSGSSYQIAQPQQRMEWLTGNPQGSHSPAGVSHFQAPQAQQQHLMHLISQPQQLQPADRISSEADGLTPTVTVDHCPNTTTVHTHSHFMMGEVPDSANAVRETLLKLQADMKASISAAKLQYQSE